MALTLADFQNRFKKLGKLIYMFQNAAPLAVAIKTIHIAFLDQTASTFSGVEDDADEFDLTQSAVIPLGNAVNTAANDINALPGKAVAAAATMLRQFIAVDLGLQSGASYVTIGPVLASVMNTAGATVAPTTGNPNGIAQWFDDQFSITLPTNATPTIPDSWITNAVV
jgi:hypothetical protein